MKDLSRLLNPRSVAVVGASEKAGAGAFVIENLRTLACTGKVIPVNPRYKSILGLESDPSVSEMPESEKVECLAILLGYKQVNPVLEEAGMRGIQGPSNHRDVDMKEKTSPRFHL